MSMHLLCRYDFIEFIRNGGRRPQAQPDSLTRQGSIELVSEASDPGQGLQPPIPGEAGPDSPQHTASSESDYTAPQPLPRASDAQHHQLVALPKLASLQTTVCFLSPWCQVCIQPVTEGSPVQSVSLNNVPRAKQSSAISRRPRLPSLPYTLRQEHVEEWCVCLCVGAFPTFYALRQEHAVERRVCLCVGGWKQG